MDNANRKHGWPFWTTIGLIFAIVIYPLSTGPAVFTVTLLDRVGCHVDFLAQGLELFYSPLLYWRSQSVTVMSVWQAYGSWWLDLADQLVNAWS